MTGRRRSLWQLVWVALFAAAFALVEASVVIYLRSLYYPGGFTFPLKPIALSHLGIELAREAATIVMLASVGVLAGTGRWERFGYFLVAFGLWDILFYIWLRVMIGWPGSLADWDVLFLIPFPWIGPVIAPVSVSLLMIFCGGLLALHSGEDRPFRPRFLSWGLGLGGTGFILLSFMIDTGAGLRGALPAPYHYEFLIAGLIAYLAGFVVAWRGR